MKYRKPFMLLSAASLLLSGCENNPVLEEKQEDFSIEETLPPVGDNGLYADEETVTRAFCVVKPRSGSKVVGAVAFTQEEGGVRITADIGGLTPGKHGFHVHEHGDCSAEDASSAGGHFNPTNMPHAGPDDAKRHVGDLGNLEANEYGFAHYERLDTVIELNGPNSIIGKSIVVHEDEDDLTSQPSGNAGKRIGCGEIHAALN